MFWIGRIRVGVRLVKYPVMPTHGCTDNRQYSINIITAPTHTIAVRSAKKLRNR